MSSARLVHVFDDQDPHAGAAAASAAGGERQGDGDAQPAVRAGVQVQGAVVGCGDGGDDRQPESDAVVRAGAVGADAAERLGQLADPARVEDRSAVLDDEPGRAGVGARWRRGSSRRAGCGGWRCRSGCRSCG